MRLLTKDFGITKADWLAHVSEVVRLIGAPDQETSERAGVASERPAKFRAPSKMTKIVKRAMKRMSAAAERRAIG
jgi:hypothetical protein